MAASNSVDTLKSCFVISPIGEGGSETRKRADQVLKHLIRPAVESLGYKATRADEIDKPGMITSQVIQSVVNDDLVIADLSCSNPNVFYELAIRHVIRKPLIQIIQKGEIIPFDVGGMRTIFFDLQDLDSVAEAKDNITKQIGEMEEKPTEMETPISISIELQQLRQSDNPEDRSYADILAAISDVRGDVQAISLRTEEIGEATARAVTRRLSDYQNIRSPLLSRRMHPGMIEELAMEQGEDSKEAMLAVVASFYKDLAPWVFELGMEAYRQCVQHPSRKANAAFIDRFVQSAKNLSRHPFYRDELRNDKMNYRALEFAEHMLFRLESR